jgi:hypothetical protein
MGIKKNTPLWGVRKVIITEEVTKEKEVSH